MITQEQKIRHAIDEISMQIHELDEKRSEQLKQLLPIIAKFDIGNRLYRDSEIAEIVGRDIERGGDHIYVTYELRKVTKGGELARVVLKCSDWNMKGWNGGS